MQESQAAANEATQTPRPQRNRRPKRRALFCPRHPKQRIEGNGKKYYLHLLQPEQLQQRGMSAKRAQLVINAYPVLVLSDEWLEELFCPLCGQSRWCQVPHHQTRPGRTQRALGSKGSLGIGRPCGSHSRQPHGE